MEYTIKGISDDGETFTIMFALPATVPSRPTFIHLYAIKALWNAHWTPGSICWQVYASDGERLHIGENY